jgi:hypothetical protein
MNSRYIDYVLYSALLLGVFASIAGGVLMLSPHLVLSGLGIIAVSALLLRFGNWLIPALLGVSGTHPVYEALELEEDAVLFREGGEWVAVGFVILEIHMSPLEEGEKQQLAYFSLLSNFYTHLPEETVISMYLSPVDIDAYRRELKRKLHTALSDLTEAQRKGEAGKERQLKLKVKELEKQLEAIDLDRPIDVAFVAKVAARNTSRDAALQTMRERRTRLESTVRGVLRVSTRVARGTEMVDVMRLVMAIPQREFF